MSTSPRTAAYFSTMRAFKEAVTVRRYDKALLLLRDGLVATGPAIVDLQDVHRLTPQSIPFLESTAGAIAALYFDEDVLSLMSAVARLDGIDREDPTLAYRRQAQVMADIRDRLQAGPVTLADLKRAAGPDAGIVTRALGWMQKRGDVTREGDLITFGRIVADALPKAPGFREGLEPIPAPPIDLSLHPRPMGRNAHLVRPRTDFRYSAGGAELTTPPLPTMLDLTVSEGTGMKGAVYDEPRVDGKPTRVRAKSGAWLAKKPSEKADGTYVTPIQVIDARGVISDRLSLPHRVVRWFESPDANWVAFLDADLTIAVFAIDGTELWAVSLAANPELLSAIEVIDRIKPSAIVHGFDIDFEREEFAFSVLDRVWWFRFDGHVVTSFRAPNVPGSGAIWDPADPPGSVAARLAFAGLPADASVRQVAAHLTAIDYAEGDTETDQEYQLSLGEPPRARTPRLGMRVSGTTAEITIGGEKSDEGDDMDPARALRPLASGPMRDWVDCVRLGAPGHGVLVSTYSGLFAVLDDTGTLSASWEGPQFSRGAMIRFRGGDVLAWCGDVLVRFTPSQEPVGVQTTWFRELGQSASAWVNGGEVFVLPDDGGSLSRWTAPGDVVSLAAHPDGFRVRTKREAFIVSAANA